MKMLLILLATACPVMAQTVRDQYEVTRNTTNIVTHTLPFDAELTYSGTWRVDYEYRAPGAVYLRSYVYHDLDFDGAWDFYVYTDKRDLSLASRNSVIARVPYRWRYASNAFVPNLDGKSAAVVMDGVEYPTSPVHWMYLTNWVYADLAGAPGQWPGFAETFGSFDLILYGPAVNGVKPQRGKYRIEWAVADPALPFSDVWIWKTPLLQLNRPATMNTRTFNVSF